VMTASGADVTRSAVGRLEAESLWLPSALVRPDVQWTARDARHVAATFPGADTVDFAITNGVGSNRSACSDGAIPAAARFDR